MDKAKPRRRRWPILLLLAVIGVGGLVGWALGATGVPQTSVVISKGEGSGKIAAKLKEAGLIRSEGFFLLYCRLTGSAAKLRPGSFTLSGQMSVGQIAAALSKGVTEELKVTLPEGLTLKQIAARLAEAKVMDQPGVFLQLARNPPKSISAPFPIPESGLEGYLHADTYRFLPNQSAEKVLTRLLEEFVIQAYRPRSDRVSKSGRSWHEIITMASLIEREAANEAERPRIAGVIANRLKRGMKLQLDATVLFAMGEHKNRVINADLKVASPYNTYRHGGLPPGPISSSSLTSIDAAISPESHEYLYYVLVPGGGKHVFSRTEAEHNRAAAAYRRWLNQESRR